MNLSVERGPLARHIGVVAAIATFLTLIRPFGADGPLWVMWLYWVVVVSWGWLVGSLTGDRLEEFAAAPVVVVVVVHAALIALAVLPLTVLAQAMLGQGPPFAAIPRMYGDVFIISLAITAFARLLNRATNPPADAHAAMGEAPPEPEQASTFFARLPAKLQRARLFAVTAEDHYVRVYTDQGDDLILMRLADAVDALARLDGMQVHRSWWVARDAVRGVDRRNGRMTLTLENGVRAPVSRTYAPRLRAAEWA
ncbi:MAG: LytTR family transcriptional regulator DNA-binding domain-containing protein [Caulobacterales bacterium]|nr:LytTR family transcriptional regulator DNA-binding domain-containing protein [Caulobacterales bacterium]